MTKSLHWVYNLRSRCTSHSRAQTCVQWDLWSR